MKKIYLLFLFFGFACQVKKQVQIIDNQQYVVVLGVAQDAGFPHPHCDKVCCQSVHTGLEKKKKVTCLGIVDKETGQVFMMEASPDFTEQERELRNHAPDKSKPISGVLVTHAHIGHYSGLMYLGREAIGAKEMPVFVMPKMKTFLETNAPWSQLVSLKNIQLKALEAEGITNITKNISVKPVIVPHRDEFSETVGFVIATAKKRILFIPDIDKWAKWQHDIVKMVGDVDVALLDATFYKNGEIPNRDMSEIPHPFMEETMKIFENSSEKNKIRFIHLNHTNPVLRNTEERKSVLKAGFGVCEEGDRVGM